MAENADHAPVLVVAPIVFLGYLLGALLLNWAVPFALPSAPAFRAAGLLFVAAGLLLGGSAARRMIKAHTSLDPHQPSSVLVMDGPFRFTRNPIYLGFVLIYLGFTFLAGTTWGILLSPFLVSTVNRAIVQMEEVYLERKFEDRYVEYRSRVRRWL